MTADRRKKKIVSLKLDDPLYSQLEIQAVENGETINDLIRRLLGESMESWCDYCETVRRLSDEEERSLHIW